MIDIKNVKFEVLADKLDYETLMDFFNQEGIKDLDYLKEDLFKSDGCIICDSESCYKSNFDYMYKYDPETNKLVRCEDTDELAIYDFVFYVCKDCNHASYYIAIEE